MKNLGNYFISALFVIHRYGIRNKPRLNLISPKPHPPPLSVRQYLLFSFFLSLSFLLSYIFDGGGGRGEATAWEARPFRPSDLLLPPFLFFSIFLLSLSLLFPFPFFSFLLSFFFFFCGGGGGQGPLGPPPLDSRLDGVNISELDSLTCDSSAAEFSHHRPQNLNPCLRHPGGRGLSRSAVAGTLAAVAYHETIPEYSDYSHYINYIFSSKISLLFNITLRRTYL